MEKSSLKHLNVRFKLKFLETFCVSWKKIKNWRLINSMAKEYIRFNLLIYKYISIWFVCIWLILRVLHKQDLCYCGSVDSRNEILLNSPYENTNLITIAEIINYSIYNNNDRLSNSLSEREWVSPTKNKYQR